MNNSILLQKLIIHIKPIFSKKEYKLYKIKNKPRFTTFKTDVLGKNIIGNDSSSFIGQYRELIERNIYKFRTSSPKPVILDCGANIGLSVFAFKRQYPRAEIIALEADPDIFSILEKNVLTLGFKNVTLLPYAVWNENTTLTFAAEGAAGGHITTSKEDGRKIKVKTIRIRDIIDKKIDFLKIDIEGAETIVLEDIEDKLHFIENIFIEYHSFDNREQTLGNILNVLQKNRFKYYIESAAPYYHQPYLRQNGYDKINNLVNIFASKDVL